MTVTDYQPSDNGLERVTIDACMDYSQITQLDSDGKPVERTEDALSRYLAEYVVAHNGPDTWWRIDDLIAHPEETC
ncbi:hypothetical protein [Isoptericola croceus]|uniref:hypothetical protein n=1 Tax=Isoptericola croceus TaxID=3031406 RepID=UPI0023F63A67|nr:hypothetical protein [Isoptericola croceus]